MGRKPKNHDVVVNEKKNDNVDINDEKQTKNGDNALAKRLAKSKEWEKKTEKARGSHVVVSHARQLLDMVDVVPTNIPSLDWALGIGGIGKGRIYEIFGDPGSGKTALMYHIMGRFQKKKKIVMFVDAEHTFDPKFAKVFGMDPEAETFLKLIKPRSTEEAFDIVGSAIEEGIVDLICVDSIPLLTPQAVVNKKVAIDRTIAMYKAQVFGNHLIELVPRMNKAGASVIFSNHVKIDINDKFAKFKDPKTKGGQEIEYNSDIRFYMVNKGKIFNTAPEPEVIGIKVQYRVIKNKQAPNYRRSQTVWLNWGRGIMVNLDIINIAKQFGVIEQTSPGWFEVPTLGKVQGFDNVVKQVISSDGLLKDIKRKIYTIIGDQKTLKDEQCEVDMVKSADKKPKSETETENESEE